jgi:GNAT superfamily N-acetyltransferase
VEIDKDKVTYRRAVLDDVQILVQFREAFLTETFPESIDRDRDLFRHSAAAYFTNAISSDLFVAYFAVYDGHVLSVGGMSTYTLPPIDTPRGRKIGYILNMYTVPEARRKGLGAHIFDLLIAEGKRQGLSNIHLRATKDGEPLYRKAGFVEPHLVELELKLT